jgi:hypothetical protein
MKISNVVIDTPIEESGFYTVFGHVFFVHICVLFVYLILFGACEVSLDSQVF